MALVSFVSGGCALGGGGHAGAAGPVMLEAASIEETVLYEPRIEPEREQVEELPYDEILASPMLSDPEFQEAVAAWVDYWSDAAVTAVPVFLARMESFQPTIDSALQAAELPPSLKFLPFIESGYNPSAASVASAVGMWQFMSGTARGMGMEVSRLLDERRDPIRSTEAAVRFLAELREDFGSWFLALAAYNGGPNRVRRILRQQAPGVEPSDSLFWALRTHFPRETREFVPKLVGAVLVAGYPRAYGIAPPDEPLRFVYDEVEVPDATTLDVVAMAAESALDEIERLNPQYVRGMTPPGRSSGLRVPEGRGRTFEVNYAQIPPEERVTFVEHRVEPGETLSHIALRYGVLVADINEANPGLRPRFLKIGAVLTVPVAPSVRSGAAGS
ncbi:MAG: transglycosylase SLT domain-containing protein [Gemmatimonadota bacterium]